MDFKQLRTFVQAADLSSFTRAGESLDLTQAAVSQQIAALERDLGVSLFERTSRRVELTEHGQSLYQYARQILQLAEETRQHLTGQSKTVSGLLRIAASTVPAETFLPEIFSAYREHYPEVSEQVTISDSHLAGQAVDSGQADVGFVGAMPASSRLAHEVVRRDTLVLVVSPESSWAKKESLTLRQLQTVPLIIRELGSGSRHCVEEAMAAKGLSLSQCQVVMEVNSNEAIRAAVRQNAGAAFLSKDSFQDDLASGRLVQLNVRGLRPQRQLYLITLSGKVPAEPLRSFLEFIKSWQQK